MANASCTIYRYTETAETAVVPDAGYLACYEMDPAKCDTGMYQRQCTN